MFSKRGVSDIVTTVLIILLVLAAVSIVGNIIMKNLQKGGEQIEKSTDCLLEFQAAVPDPVRASENNEGCLSN